MIKRNKTKREPRADKGIKRGSYKLRWEDEMLSGKPYNEKTSHHVKSKFPHSCLECRMALVNSCLSDNHLNSVYHKHAARIRALLDTECVSHVEIAERLNITRERVRQIAIKMGYPSGRERQQVCVLRKSIGEPSRDSIKQLNWKTKNSALCLILDSLGYEYKFTAHKRLIVNGQTCVVQYITRSRCQTDHTVSQYGEVRVYASRAQFSISKQPDGNWYIVDLTGLADNQQYIFCLDPKKEWLCHFGFTIRPNKQDTMAARMRAGRDNWEILAVKSTVEESSHDSQQQAS